MAFSADRQPKFEAFVSNEHKPDYAARYPLGEYNNDLKGVALEVSTNSPGAIRIDVSPELADPVVASELIKAMKSAGNFHQGSPEGPNEFIFIPSAEAASPRSAIYKVMESPAMIEVVSQRRPEMQRREDERSAQLQRENDAAWERSKAESQARDAARAEAEQSAT